MSTIRNIISILLTICLCSCAADMHYDAIYDNNITMGNIVDGSFISDQGITYNIVGQTCNYNIDTVKRSMISCDIVSRVDASTYNILLTGFEEIFTKMPVDSTAISDEEMLVENPLNIGEVWYAGGYLNMLVSVPIKKDSKQAHMINLVRNDQNDIEGVYEFTFRHNAHGEVITAEDTDFIQGNRYVSFPISHLFKQDEKNVNIFLNWISNKEDNGLWTHEIQKNKISLPVVRNGYEHKHWE